MNDARHDERRRDASDERLAARPDAGDGAGPDARDGARGGSADAGPVNAEAVDAGAAAPTGAATGEGSADPRRWRETLAAGHFERASRERLLAVGSGHEADDPEEATTVRALADVQGLLRDKAWSRALRRVEDLDARPPLLDWPRLEADLGRLKEAGVALDRRDVDAALALLEDHDPAGSGAAVEAEHLALLGTAMVLDGRDVVAARRFDRALELDPKHHRVMVNLGNVALEAGRVDDAIELYQQALKLDEGFANAHHNLGVAYRRKGQVGKSVRSLRRAQRADRTREGGEAREQVRGLGARLGGGRAVRWVVWAVIAAVVVWVLLNRV